MGAMLKTPSASSRRPRSLPCGLQAAHTRRISFLTHDGEPLAKRRHRTRAPLAHRTTVTQCTSLAFFARDQPLRSNSGMRVTARAGPRRFLGAARPRGRRTTSTRTHRTIASRLSSGGRRNLSARGHAELHARAPRLGKADRDRLLARPHVAAAVFEFFHFLTNELTGLRSRLLSLSRVAARALKCACFGHDVSGLGCGRTNVKRSVARTGHGSIAAPPVGYLRNVWRSSVSR